MSTMYSKRQLQFHVIQFYQSGNVYSLNFQGLVLMDSIKGTGKGQVEPQTYRFITPRPTTSVPLINSAVYSSTLRTVVKTFAKKIVESPKPDETPLKILQEFPTTTSNRPTVNWIEQVQTYILCKAPCFKVSFQKVCSWSAQ